MASKDYKQASLEAGSEKEGLSSRRRVLLAGLAAAPVVLTLMNRSAWASSCSQPTVASYQQGGLTASFQARTGAYLNGGGQLQCK